MKGGIICAGDDELAMLKFYEGQIQDTKVVALLSGVYRVNAVIAAQI